MHCWNLLERGPQKNMEIDRWGWKTDGGSIWWNASLWDIGTTIYSMHRQAREEYNNLQ